MVEARRTDTHPVITRFAVHTWPLAALLTLLASAWALTGTANSATSGASIGASVPTATALNVTACDPNNADRTAFGPMFANSSAVTASDCNVTFSSSNSTARLRMRQVDRGGTAMRSRPTGDIDDTFGTSGEVFGEPITDPDESMMGWAAASGPDDTTYMVRSIHHAISGEYRLSVERFDASGTADPAWNGGAVVDRTGPTTGNVPTNSYFQLANAVVVLDDGAIRILAREPAGDTVVYGYTSTGAADTTFGPGGRRLIQSAAIPGFVVYYPEDRLVVGVVDPSTNTLSTRRINALTGALDTNTWASPSATSFDVSSDCSTTLQVMAVVPGNNGSLIWGGSCTEDGGTDGELLIGHMNSVGRPTSSFTPAENPPSGYVVLPRWGATAPIITGMLRSGSNVYLTRFDTSGVPEIELIRFDIDTGIPDPTWGIAGDGRRQYGTFGHDVAVGSSMVGDGDGFLLYSTLVTPTSEYVVHLLRLRGNGDVDTTFGSNGAAAVGLPIQSIANTLLPLSGGNFAASYLADADTTPKFGFARLDAASFPDYPGSWGPAGGFGVCLRQLVNATAQAPWAEAVGNTCSQSDAASWRAIPTLLDATVAATTVNGINATARFRFGVRSAADQVAGRYEAPIRFEVVAP